MKVFPITLEANDPYFREFVNLPYALHQNDPSWIPPLKASQIAELSAAHNPFFAHADVMAFLCTKGDQVVGRILASRDRLFPPNSTGGLIGHFGYFECVNDSEAAKTLFQAAESWLAGMGVTEVHGPLQLSIYNRYRFMTKGFETLPFVGEPRNPEYYVSLCQENGYQGAFHWSSWELPVPVAKMLAAGAKAKAAEMKGSEDVTIVPIDPQSFLTEVPLVFSAVLQTFAENYGFTAISLQEFTFFFGGLQYLLRPGSFCKAVEKSGTVVGFVYGYPNHAQAFQKMNGDAGQFSLLAASHPQEFVAHTFGTVPEYRKSPLAFELASKVVEINVQDPALKIVFGALAKEGRTIYDKVGPASRTYSVFKKTR